MEKIRTQLFQHEEAEIRTTASLGLAAFLRGGGGRLGKLFVEGPLALYQAKQSGHDQLVVYSESWEDY